MSLNAYRSLVLMPYLRAAWPLGFVLAGMANHDGLLWPSIPYLAIRMGLSPGRVKCHMRALRNAGLLLDTGERKGKNGRIVVYRLTLPPLAALQTEMERCLAEARSGDDGETLANGIENAPIDGAEIVSKAVPLNGVNGLVSEPPIGSFSTPQSARFRYPELVKESFDTETGVASTTATGSRDAPASERIILGNASSRRAIAQMRASLRCGKVKP